MTSSSSEWYACNVHTRLSARLTASQANGTDIPNFTSVNLEGDITPEREELVKNAASSLYAGGADTVCTAQPTYSALTDRGRIDGLCYQHVLPRHDPQPRGPEEGTG